MPSNLPPGCSAGSIPGNRSEDLAWEQFCDWALDKLTQSDLDIRECRRAVLAGIAAVKAESDEFESAIDEAIDARTEDAIYAAERAAEGE